MKNLSEISNALAKLYPELTNKKALAITRTVIDLVKQGLCEIEPDSRERVALAGFGNLGVKATAARTVKNIKTGEPVEVGASVRITFKPADELRKLVLTRDFKAAVSPEEDPAEAPAEDEQKTKPAKKAKDDVDTSSIPDLNDL